MSEQVKVKAEAYARAGAVTITRSTDDTLVAQVVGRGGTYTVSVDPAGHSCTCPAGASGHRQCSHLMAAVLYERWGALWDAERRAGARQARRDRANVVHVDQEGAT